MQEFLKKHTKGSEKPSQDAADEAARDVRDAEIADDQWGELIAECRGNYRVPLLESDRNVSRLSLTTEFLDLLRRRDDVLLSILKEQNTLHESGEVFWCQLIEANKLLFNANNEHTLPAAIIYSTDKSYDNQPEQLEKISQGLLSMKDATDDGTELGAFVATIKRDFEQILRLELPRAITGGRPVYYATVLVQPQYLPGNTLAKTRFPVVASFEKTETAMLLPAHFWPNRLLKHWQMSN